MSHYRGPRLRLMRALGVELPGLSRKSTERRPYPPGQHGSSAGAKRKLSTYGLQLREKQKLRFNYGVSERQLRRYVAMAFKSKGDPGQSLLQILERRLDNVVFRAGLAPTIPAARQLVSHGHVRINAKRVDIASYLVKPGEEITLTSKALTLPVVVSTIDQPSLQRPGWLSFEPTSKATRIERFPDRDSFPFAIQESMIVEYYSQRS